MRSLDRDRRRCLVARFKGLERTEDGQGRLTGRNEPVYAYPEEFWPTVTPARGDAIGDVFGQRIEYDVALTVDDPLFVVSEADALWVDGPDVRDPYRSMWADGNVDGGWLPDRRSDPADGGYFENWEEGISVDGGDLYRIWDIPHTHRIVRIARTPNQTIVAARKVDVSR